MSAFPMMLTLALATLLQDGKLKLKCNVTFQIIKRPKSPIKVIANLVSKLLVIVYLSQELWLLVQKTC